MPKLLLATRNAHKVRELRDMLGAHGAIEVVDAAAFPTVADPEETEETFLGNAAAKALHYAAATGLTALADDSGLVVDALGGRPGVYSSRYAPTDTERIARVLKELDQVPPARRSARFVCAMALAAPGKVLAATIGTVEGQIADTPRGTGGFGYDPIFHVGSLDRRLAELSMAEKNAVSHRGRALRAMLPLIRAALRA
ncbi:MAG: RdgB/HAM1 family non-canonical purine NTP pyrophosphatase [Candidatus Sumerlaeaceae bacterium]|nr:RdgB/HAM1 family non-canonical purine NTP pyrophosphatase [Candidatus Sumerlaeaceae bacterium]